MKILVVEDDFTSRILLQRYLSSYGDCHIAINGKEAVGAFKDSLKENQPYDLICMDIIMPEMSGQEALKNYTRY
jgi:two-component system chemotaxis response regulator CheY